jgi:glycosyltransferase involved in cell wall biosynthesis
MDSGGRSSICYVVPGHHLLSSSGPTRNVLSLAGALSANANVTVAFRRVLETPQTRSFAVAEIEPGPTQPAPLDDAALRGVGVAEFAGYLRAVRRFARGLSEFDLVLEKSWLLTGYVSSRVRRLGVACVPMVNVVPLSPTARVGLGKLAKNLVGAWISARHLRRAPLVVVETAELRAALIERWRLASDRIEVIGLGVDRHLFRPLDRAESRRRLGIPEQAIVLVYIGALDRIHDLRPVIDAILKVENPCLRMHVVGDGALADDLRAAARGHQRITFHGRVAHHEVPSYIAAADLCIAPYDATAFADGEVSYATLKVREYLAGGRPVATLPSGSLRELIRDAHNGFLLSNDSASWQTLLRRIPPRERLAEMGTAAATTRLESWDDVARALHAACDRLRRPGRADEAGG